MKGRRLGPYELDDKLGEGGMGAVYLASDTRLGRSVAIKILPEQFATDADRLARFEREARAAAALSHPHIAAVFDVGVEGSTHYIVQEYLRGQSLRERLDAGVPPLPQGLQLAVEVAEGIAAAHAAGVTHRDLKPENVFVTTDGHAKILDFGLAKLTEKVIRGDGSATQSPTIVATSTGQIMGTAGYMAPEQITGEDVDHRADLFAFGCVLYELVTGRKTFGGKNLPEVLHRLANEDPEPVTSVNRALPVGLQRIVAKCLAKDPARRYQGAPDLVVDLRQLRDDVEAGRTTTAGPVATATSARGRSPALIAAAGLLGLLLGAGAIWMSGAGSRVAGPGRPTYLPLRDIDGLDAENHSQSAISPDGRFLAFATGRGPIVLWALEEALGERFIDETDGAIAPFFSPDGHWLAYVGVDNRFYRVPVSGGRPQPFSEPLGPRVSGARWLEGGDILLHTSFEHVAMRLSGDSGVPEDYIPFDSDAGEFGQGTVDPLPGGERVVYSYWDDRWRVGVRDLVSGERTALTQGYGARYVATGHLVWILSQQLMGATFDPETLELGEPVQLLTAIAASPGWGRPSFDFDASGTLLYLEEPEDRGTAVVRIDEDDDQTVVLPPDRNVSGLALSPDQSRLALSFLTLDGDTQIWSYDMRRQDLVPIAQADGWDQYPTFLPDGNQIGYISERDRTGDFYVRAADGTGPEQRLIIGDPYLNSPHANRAGDVVSEVVDPETRSPDIWVFPADARDNPVPVISTPGAESFPRFSPDGAFIAYSSSRTGRSEVYVVAYPGGAEALDWKVTTEGGTAPRWTADGRYLFYFSTSTGGVWRVPVLGTSPFRTGVPTEFTDVRVTEAAWDVGPDGTYVVAAESLRPPRPRLILNWFAELERRLPTR